MKFELYDNLNIHKDHFQLTKWINSDNTKMGIMIETADQILDIKGTLEEINLIIKYLKPIYSENLNV